MLHAPGSLPEERARLLETVEIINHVLFVYFLSIFITFSTQTPIFLIVYLKCQTKYIFKTGPINRSREAAKENVTQSEWHGRNILKIIDLKCFLDGLRRRWKELNVLDSNRQLGQAPLACPFPPAPSRGKPAPPPLALSPCKESM